VGPDAAGGGRKKDDRALSSFDGPVNFKIDGPVNFKFLFLETKKSLFRNWK
jgi:hypothetical protein